MADLQNYNDIFADLAQRAHDGEFGDQPFDSSTEGGERLYREAYEKAGLYDIDSWFDESGSAGGSIMDSIHSLYDSITLQEDSVDSPYAAAHEIEEREQANYGANTADTLDNVILDSEDPQLLVDTIVSRNETKIENGEPLTSLEPETIDALNAKGVDTSALEKQFSDKDKQTKDPVDRTETEFSPEVVSTTDVSTPFEVQSPRSFDTPTINGTSYDDQAEASSEFDYHVVYDDDGAPIDVVFYDEDGVESSLRDIIQNISEDEDMKEVIKTATSIANEGGDVQAFLDAALEEYIAKQDLDKKDETPDNSTVDNDAISNAEKDSLSDVDPSAKDDSARYEENFEKHSQALEDRKNHFIKHKSNSVDGFHDMAKIYNAHMGGIEINGKIPSKVDVFVSAINFLKTNILETAVIELLRAIFDTEKKEDKVDIDPNSPDYADLPRDKFGIQENGDIDHVISTSDAKDISAFRSELPEAGKMCGADMTKVDRGSTPDVIIRSTNPSGVDGRGVSVTLDDAKKITFPDVRLVDIKGERILVDPFGKVLSVTSDGDKYKIGDTLSGLDVSGNGKGKEAIETYARDNNISVQEAKDKISQTIQERFCGRIEASFSTEAKAIEKSVIPRELETKADLVSKLANLNNIEKGTIDPEKRVNIGKMKDDVSKAIETIDSRIDTLRTRVSDLERSAGKSTDRPISDRFGDAVSSEKKAVGRSVFTTDLGIEKVKIEQTVSNGVEAIKDRVAAHNATVPEYDRISYDSKTGTFVDRFGIDSNGEYVGNKNGKFMGDDVSGPTTKADESKYVETYEDKSRFSSIDDIITNKEMENDKDHADKKESDVTTTDSNENDLTEKNEEDRDAIDKSEEDRDATDKSEEDRDATDKSEEGLDATDKSEEDRDATDKSEGDQDLVEKSDGDQDVVDKGDETHDSIEKNEEDHDSIDKNEENHDSTEKSENDEDYVDKDTDKGEDEHDSVDKSEEDEDSADKNEEDRDSVDKNVNEKESDDAEYISDVDSDEEDDSNQDKNSNDDNADFDYKDVDDDSQSEYSPDNEDNIADETTKSDSTTDDEDHDSTDSENRKSDDTPKNDESREKDDVEIPTNDNDSITSDSDSHDTEWNTENNATNEQEDDDLNSSDKSANDEPRDDDPIEASDNKGDPHEKVDDNIDKDDDDTDYIENDSEEDLVDKLDNSDVDVQNVDAQQAVNIEDDTLDPTVYESENEKDFSNEEKSKDDADEDEEEKSIFDDLIDSWKESFEEALSFFDDPIGWQVDRWESQVDNLCDLIDALGGNADLIREVAHDVLDGILELFHGAEGPMEQESVTDFATDFFESVGEKMEDPSDFHESLMKELNSLDEFGSDYEFVDHITDGFIEGANKNEETNNDFEIADGIEVTPDGVVDTISGEEVGGFPDEFTEHEFITEVDQNSLDVVEAQIDTLGEDSAMADIATDIPAEIPADASTPDVESYSSDIAMDDPDFMPDSIPESADIDIGVDAFSTGVEAVEAVEAEGALEVIAALL